MAPIRLPVPPGALAAASPAAANESAYTTIDLAACREEAPDPDDPLQSGVWWCEGYGGMAVRVAEGDLRFMVSFGERAAEERAAEQTLPRFNTIGGTLEWRLKADGGQVRPIATILRYFTDAEAEGGPKGQFLMITRLGPPGSVCVVGYVDALVNKDANALAREVADNASEDFDCSREQPLQYGLIGGEDDAQE
ncbi:MAG TPA: hypothetical protein PKA74_02465 [Bauldia sp.]|nr:hypothetical protein [Bauldia sp.]